MAKSVKFRVDENSEMLEVWVGDKCVNEANFWDFDFVRDVPYLLHKIGVECEIEDYEYDDGFDDEEEEDE